MGQRQVVSPTAFVLCVFTLSHSLMQHVNQGSFVRKNLIVEATFIYLLLVICFDSNLVLSLYTY